MTATVEAIFIASEAGAPMRRVERVHAKRGFGLEGDRYCLDGKEKEGEHCQVTLVGARALREAEESFDVNLSNGEHRRNLVIRGIDLEALNGKRFKLGEAVLEYTGQRPPCGYLESLTEPGMAKALVGKGGICVQVLTSGWIEEEAALELLPSALGEGAA